MVGGRIVFRKLIISLQAANATSLNLCKVVVVDVCNVIESRVDLRVIHLLRRPERKLFDSRYY